MKHVRQFAKYQLVYFKNSVLTYYFVVFLVALMFNRPGSGNTLSGSMVFILVLGLNWFKTSFRFSQANNLSRKTFYFATILAILAMSVFMSVVDVLLDSVFKNVQVGFFGQLYPPNNFAEILWSIAVLATFASLGWMINMMYYRANGPMKIAISFSPVLVIWLMVRLNDRIGGKLANSFMAFAIRAFGLAGEVPNPYAAIISFAVLTLVILVINGLLMHRTPIKA